MIPKGTILCVLGVGCGAMVGHSLLDYEYVKEIIITDTPTLEGIDADVCKKPLKKATITTDESVVYYICDEISIKGNNSKTSPEVTFNTSISKSILKREAIVQGNTTPVKGTHTQKNKEVIDFYGHTPPTHIVHKDVFYIHKPNPTAQDSQKLSNSVIRTIVKDIEQLRIYQSITITNHTTNIDIDQIFCQPSKKAIVSSDKKIEYYFCTDISGSFPSPSKKQQKSQSTTNFTHKTTFKAAKGNNYIISDGTHTTPNPTLAFYGLKPVNKTKTEIFFVKDTTPQMTDTNIKNLIMKIIEFQKEQKL